MSIYVKLCNQLPSSIILMLKIQSQADCQPGVTKWFNPVFVATQRDCPVSSSDVADCLFKVRLLDTFIKNALKKVEQLDTTIHDHWGAY